MSAVLGCLILLFFFLHTFAFFPVFCNYRPQVLNQLILVEIKGLHCVYDPPEKITVFKGPLEVNFLAGGL